MLCRAANSELLEFTKFQGLGNDFILVREVEQLLTFLKASCACYLSCLTSHIYNDGPVMHGNPAWLMCIKCSAFLLCVLQVDNRHQKEPVISSEQAKSICDRNFGVGGDGVSVSNFAHFKRQACLQMYMMPLYDV